MDEVKPAAGGDALLLTKSLPAQALAPAARVESIAKRIARRFDTRWNYFYVRSKVRTDPVYSAMADHLAGSTLPLLDLGCGLGVFAFYLRERGFAPPIHGCDYDERKITAARKAAAHYADLNFECADVRERLPDHAGNVSILDILQYLPPGDQPALLAGAARRVAPGGYLLLRGQVRDTSWRCRLTHVCDFFAHGIRWMKGRPSHYPSIEEITTPLEEAGLSGTVKPLWGRTPFNNYLFVFRRG